MGMAIEFTQCPQGGGSVVAGCCHPAIDFDEGGGASSDATAELVAAVERLEGHKQTLETCFRAMVHDTEPLLRGISMRAHLLRERLGDRDPEGRELVDGLVRGAAKLTQLVAGLYRAVRLQGHEVVRADVDLSGIAYEIVDELRRNDPHRIARVNIQPGLSARGDPVLLRLLLENLLGNAWKYTAEMGYAHIAFGRRAQAGPAVYDVADNGIGFAQEETAKLFAPFARLDGARGFEGTGLGLSIVKGIVESHGGWIRAQGKAGAGATFIFSF